MSKGLYCGAFVLVLALLAGWLWYRFNGGVSHGDLRRDITAESVQVRAQVDRRADAIERRLARIEGTLERLDAKFDRLIERIERPVYSDGLKPIENQQ